MKQKPEVRYVNGLTALDAAKSIVGRIALGAVFFASGVTWEAPPVILGSLVLFGSTLPVWLKARKFERLRAGSDSLPLPQPPEHRRLEAEVRNQEQLAELSQAAQQVEDLQERLEFLERLVAKRQQELS